MLNEHGLSGTYYAALGLMGTITESGEMFRPEDLGELVASGHELGCHTFDHVPCGSLSVSEVVNNCEKNKAAVCKIVPGYELRNFSFPFGSIALSPKCVLGARYLTCRSIEPGINRGIVDLALLRAYSLYGSKDRVMVAMKENEIQRGWLVLYTHDVTPAPSKYGCTPNIFREVLRCAIASGAEILPIQEAAERITDGAH